MRALLLDLGNVLVRFDHGLTLKRIENETSVPAEALKVHLFGDLVRDLDAGRLGPDEFFRAVEKRAGLPRLPDEIWVPAWRDIFTPVSESLALLPHLRADVATALVSNTNALHWDGVRRIADVERWMDAFALSFEVGAAKPDRKIFDTALARLGATDGTPAFADDRTDYVAAAKKLGLDAFVVDSPATFERELRLRNLISDERFERGKEPLFEKGTEEFRRGRFFEAHEDWEALWKTKTGREKVFLQGLIQLAAGLVHLQRGNATPARRLFDLALEKLRTFARSHAGLPIGKVCKELRGLGAGADAIPQDLPRHLAQLFTEGE